MSTGKSAFPKRQRSRWQILILFLFGTLVALGICFRISNLDHRFYWHDETFTSLRISGATETELVQDLANTRIVEIGYINQKYQRFNPDKTMLDTVYGLANEEAQLTPLYYVLTRLWAQFFGSSIASVRAFPAVLSCFTLPIMYWLCLELFSSRLTAGIAVVLLSVSPFQMLYAQESRHYSLWIGTLLLSSWLLLRSLRLQTKAGWLAYSGALVLGLYSGLLTLLLALGHGIYVWANERFRLTKSFVNYLAASALGILAFLPWLIIIAYQRSQLSRILYTGGAQVGQQTSLSELIRGWIRQPRYPFVELNLSLDAPSVYLKVQNILTFILLFATIYAIYILCRTATKQVWLFIITLTTVTWACLVIQDFTLKSQLASASINGRYMIPTYLGFQLAVSYLFARQLTAGSPKFQWLWRSVISGLILLGLMSCVMLSQASYWFSKGGPGYHRTTIAAQIINRASNPILVTDATSWDLLVVSWLLRPEVKVLSQPGCLTCKLSRKGEFNPDLSKVSEQFSEIFVFPAPSEELLQRLQAQGFNLIKKTVTDNQKEEPKLMLYSLEKAI